jgi:LysR family transcriptional regulator, hydrogen peroxide-inducible genes activator
VPVTLRQMRCAVAVAQTGHFGRAAELCAISQPALSQQIQTLEALCGTPVFDRLKTGVRLTPFGREFVALAGEALARAEAVEGLVRGNRGLPDRPVRFGLIPTVAPYLLPQIYPALTSALPQLRFAVSESRTEALLGSLEDGTLDLALIATEPPGNGPRLHVEALFDDAFVLATPRDEEASALTALPPERILLLDEGHCFRDQAIAACQLDGERHTFAATSLSTIVEFVANGQGVTLLPEIALRKEASDPRIAVHRLGEPGPGRKLLLVWRQASPFAATFGEIAAVIRAARPMPEPSASGSAA